MQQSLLLKNGSMTMAPCSEPPAARPTRSLPAPPTKTRSKKRKTVDTSKKSAPASASGRSTLAPNPAVETLVVEKYLSREAEKVAAGSGAQDEKSGDLFYACAMPVNLIHKNLVPVWAHSPTILLHLHEQKVGGESGFGEVEILSSGMQSATISQFMCKLYRRNNVDPEVWEKYRSMVTLVPQDDKTTTFTLRSDLFKKALENKPKYSTHFHLFIKQGVEAVLVFDNVYSVFRLNDTDQEAPLMRPSRAINDFAKAFVDVPIANFDSILNKVKGEKECLTYLFNDSTCKVSCTTDDGDSTFDEYLDTCGSGLVSEQEEGAEEDDDALKYLTMDQLDKTSGAAAIIGGRDAASFFSSVGGKSKKFYLSRALLAELHSFLSHANFGSKSMRVYFCNEADATDNEDPFIISCRGSEHYFVFLVAQAIPKRL